MSNTTALQDQALAAAASVLVDLIDVLPVELHKAVRVGLAIAWLDGRAQGGAEAQAAVDRLLASLK